MTPSTLLFAGPSPLNKLAASTWSRACLIVFFHHAFVLLQVILSCMPFPDPWKAYPTFWDSSGAVH
jgi:hypothetical protein